MIIIQGGYDGQPCDGELMDMLYIYIYIYFVQILEIVKYIKKKDFWVKVYIYKYIIVLVWGQFVI